MHADKRNPLEASTAVAETGPDAFLIRQKLRLSLRRSRLLLATGVVGRQFWCLAAPQPMLKNSTIHCNKKSPRSSSRSIVSRRKPSPLFRRLCLGAPSGFPGSARSCSSTRCFRSIATRHAPLPYAADRFPGSDREPEQGCSRAARLGQDTLQSAQAAKRRICRVLAAFVL